MISISGGQRYAFLSTSRLLLPDPVSDQYVDLLQRVVLGWKERAMYFYDTTEPPESGEGELCNKSTAPLNFTGETDRESKLGHFFVITRLVIPPFIIPHFFNLIEINVNILLL